MAVEFACPSCGNAMRVPDRLAGQAGRCNRCGAAVTVPEPSGGLPRAAPRSASRREGRWCLVLHEARGQELAGHADALAGPLGLSHADAREVLGACGGIVRVPRWADPDEALAAMADLGIGASLVELDRVLPLPDMERVRHITWDDAGLSAWSESPLHAVRCTWADVTAVVCGTVVEQHRAKLVTGRPAFRGTIFGPLWGTQTEPVTHESEQALADVVSRRPWFRVRLTPGFLEFDVLGDLQTSSAAWNLRALLKALVPRCRMARTNVPDEILALPASPAAAGHGHVQLPEFRSLREFDAHVHWFINAAAGAQRD